MSEQPNTRYNLRNQTLDEVNPDNPVNNYGKGRGRKKVIPTEEKMASDDFGGERVSNEEIPEEIQEPPLNEEKQLAEVEENRDGTLLPIASSTGCREQLSVSVGRSRERSVTPVGQGTTNVTSESNKIKGKNQIERTALSLKEKEMSIYVETPRTYDNYMPRTPFVTPRSQMTQMSGRLDRFQNEKRDHFVNSKIHQQLAKPNNSDKRDLIDFSKESDLIYDQREIIRENLDRQSRIEETSHVDLVRQNEEDYHSQQRLVRQPFLRANLEQERFANDLSKESEDFRGFDREVARNDRTFASRYDDTNKEITAERNSDRLAGMNERKRMLNQEMQMDEWEELDPRRSNYETARSPHKLAVKRNEDIRQDNNSLCILQEETRQREKDYRDLTNQEVNQRRSNQIRSNNVYGYSQRLSEDYRRKSQGQLKEEPRESLVRFEDCQERFKKEYDTRPERYKEELVNQRRDLRGSFEDSRRYFPEEREGYRRRFPEEVDLRRGRSRERRESDQEIRQRRYEDDQGYHREDFDDYQGRGQGESGGSREEYPRRSDHRQDYDKDWLDHYHCSRGRNDYRGPARQKFSWDRREERHEDYPPRSYNRMERYPESFNGRRQEPYSDYPLRSDTRDNGYQEFLQERRQERNWDYSPRRREREGRRQDRTRWSQEADYHFRDSRSPSQAGRGQYYMNIWSTLRKYGIEFSGQRDGTALQFLSQMEDFRENSGFDDQSIIRILPRVMKGIANSWAQQNLQDWWDWRDFVRDFRDTYLGVAFQQRLRSEIVQRTQGPHENVQDFIVKIRDMLRQLEPRMSEEEELDRVYLNLLSPFQLRFDRSQFSSFRELERLVAKYQSCK